MGLPINIKDLVTGSSVEWERLEFKKGWNPEVVIRSMCAFANDINNWSGGYIIIGVEENGGKPILPPFGLIQQDIDTIQKEIIQLGHRISPNYFPISQPYVIDGQHILVLWCPAGDNRPYQAPEAIAKGSPTHHYIRVGSNSIQAKGDYLRQLFEQTARIPFDDRVNNRATLENLDLGLIQAYLQEIKSDLYEESLTMPFPELCRAMLIAKGSDENIRPINAGLLFFSKNPELFFNRPWIELVWHQDHSGNNFSEHYFKGPLHKQLRDVLSFLNTNIIGGEQVIKLEDKAEAIRFFKFPYAAVEEAISNAVYHKSYEIDAPIEIQVWPDKMEILSFPAAIPPVNKAVISSNRRIIARQYRNRRIGDFLKELHLTEGRGTGFPTIHDSMEKNGSPKPIFDSDDSTYFLTILPAHPTATIQVSNQVSNQVGNQVKMLVFNTLDEIIEFANTIGNGASNGASNGAGNGAGGIISEQVHSKVKEILTITSNWISREDIFNQIGLTNQSKNRLKYIDPLLNLTWIEMRYPNNKTNPNQQFRITEAGKRILNLISE